MKFVLAQMSKFVSKEASVRNRAIKELSAYSDAELNDLGLSKDSVRYAV